MGGEGELLKKSRITCTCPTKNPVVHRYLRCFSYSLQILPSSQNSGPLSLEPDFESQNREISANRKPHDSEKTRPPAQSTASSVPTQESFISLEEFAELTAQAQRLATKIQTKDSSTSIASTSVSKTITVVPSSSGYASHVLSSQPGTSGLVPGIPIKLERRDSVLVIESDSEEDKKPNIAHPG